MIERCTCRPWHGIHAVNCPKALPPKKVKCPYCRRRFEVVVDIGEQKAQAKKTENP